MILHIFAHDKITLPKSFKIKVHANIARWISVETYQQKH